MTSNSTPKKALLIYCPFQPNQPIPNVDMLTLKGCLGQMALEEAKGAISLFETIFLYINFSPNVTRTIKYSYTANIRLV